MKQKSILWSSVSVLTTAVIAILAFVRGSLALPLLIGAFALWGLWVVWSLLLPAWRSVQMYRRRERQQQRFQDTMAEAHVTDPEVAATLLRHVNYRISAYLQAAYPDVKWEWLHKEPALLAVQGGTGRLRVHGVPDFEFADVVLDKNGGLSCSLVKVQPVQQREPKDSALTTPQEQPVDPQVWYELQGRKTLEALIADLRSRGHSSISLREDGRICIQSDDSEETVAGAFRSFPEKMYWPRLAKVLEQEGLAADVWDDCIAVTW